MKTKFFACILFLISCSLNVFAFQNATGEEGTAAVTAVQNKAELTENIVLKFSGEFQYMLMTDLNNVIYTGNLYANYPTKGYTLVNTGILGSLELDYRSNSIYIGPRIGYLYCIPGTRTYSNTVVPAASYKSTYSPSLIPLEISAGYDLPIKKIISSLDIPVFINLALYTGYAWAAYSVKNDVTNDATNGTYSRVINYYGGGASSELKAGLKYADSKGAGLTAGLNIGYRYAIIPYLKTDKDYTVTTSNGKVLTVKANTSYNNFTSMDYRGITGSLDLGYAF